MASSHPHKDKLIFAPAGPQAHGQAPQFTLSTLHRNALDPISPTRQFHNWYETARSCPTSQIKSPETCVLSTASLPTGRVSSRVVYLKELDSLGRFVVYTNLGTSRKAADLATNPWCSLVFWWEPLQRQVRVEGKAERLSREESQRYFDTRARGSRVGAWASRQSRVLEPVGDVEGDDGRARLEGWVREVEERFGDSGDEIPVPEFWGGVRVVPEMVEFWQGRESRLHDRFVYTRKEEGESSTSESEGGDGSRKDGKEKEQAGEGKWKLERLSP